MSRKQAKYTIARRTVTRGGAIVVEKFRRCSACKHINGLTLVVCRRCGAEMRKPPRRGPLAPDVQLKIAEQQLRDWQRRLTRATTGIKAAMARVQKLRTAIAVAVAVRQERAKQQTILAGGRSMRIRPEATPEPEGSIGGTNAAQ
jgi:hypothetical protein